MTIPDESASPSAESTPDRRPLNRTERIGLWMIFGGIAVILGGLALPTLRVLISDGRWLAVTPCALLTGLGSHLSGADPGPCAAPFQGTPVLGWIGNLHNRNVVAWGFWIFMIGLYLGTGPIRNSGDAAQETSS